MELVFPFKNITVHTLIDFISAKEYKDFSLLEKNEYPYSTNYFQDNVDHYRGYIVNAQNELKQVVETTGQSTIDEYFNALGDDLNYVQDLINEDHLAKEIKAVNADNLNRFLEKIQVSEDLYFKSESRKREHLEEYETVSYLGLFGGYDNRKIKHINYNYYCIEEKLDLIDEQFIGKYISFVKELYNDFFVAIAEHGRLWTKGELVSKLSEMKSYKPIVFLEGTLDIDYIKQAAQVLGRSDLLQRVELKSGGGAPNMDNIWRLFKDSEWEDLNRIKILLYDCDTNKQDEQLKHVYKRVIQKISENPLEKGIENLFPQATIEKLILHNPALVDRTITTRFQRGQEITTTKYMLNEHEKRNVCNYLVSSGTKDDFEYFESIFNMLQELLSPL